MKDVIKFDFDKIFLFKGSEILYPTLALFCWGFYISLFGFGLAFQELSEQTPEWLHYACFLLLCIPFMLMNIWCYEKGYISKRLIAINTFVYTLSFFMIGNKMYHNRLALIEAEALVSIFCAYKAFRRPLNLKINGMWLMPIAYVACYVVCPKVIEIIVSTAVVLIFSTFHECKRNNSIRCILSSSMFFVYAITTLAYCLYNPLLSTKNIVGIDNSYDPRGATLVVKVGDKYELINGFSLRGDRFVDVEFDTWKADKGLMGCGFEVNNKHTYNRFFSEEIFPIIIRGNHVFFSTRSVVFDELNKIIRDKTAPSSDSIMAKLYYDYIDLCSNGDSVTRDRVLEDADTLQHLILNSLYQYVESNQFGPENKLGFLSEAMTQGTLNALAMDFLLNDDYLSAVEMFSIQFMLHFYDKKMYNCYDFSLEFISKNGNMTTKSPKIKKEALNNDNTLETRTNIFYFVQLYAQSVVDCIKQDEKIDAEKRLGEASKMLLPPKRVDHAKVKEELAEIQHMLADYSRCPNLNYYSSQLQQFLFSCVKENRLPDYNAYFINRFNEVSAVVPMDSLSYSAYKGFKTFYDARFDKDKESVNQIVSGFWELQQKIDSITAVEEKRDQIIRTALMNAKKIAE